MDSASGITFEVIRIFMIIFFDPDIDGMGTGTGEMQNGLMKLLAITDGLVSGECSEKQF